MNVKMKLNKKFQLEISSSHMNFGITIVFPQFGIFILFIENKQRQCKAKAISRRIYEQCNKMNQKREKTDA